MPQNLIRRYLRHGTLSQLFVFEAVARLGNFTRASEELFMAQPSGCPDTQGWNLEWCLLL